MTIRIELPGVIWLGWEPDRGIREILEWNCHLCRPGTIRVLVVVERSVNRHCDFHSPGIPRQLSVILRRLAGVLLLDFFEIDP